MNNHDEKTPTQLWLVTRHDAAIQWDASPVDNLKDGDWGHCIEFHCVKATSALEAMEIVEKQRLFQPTNKHCKRCNALMLIRADQLNISTLRELAEKNPILKDRYEELCFTCLAQLLATALGLYDSQ